jgi:hypothetical protein
MRYVAGLLAFLLWLDHPAANAQPATGTSVSGTVVMNGRTVPLPPGEWTSLGRQADESIPRQTGATTRLGGNSVLLAQEKDGRLAGLVSIVVGDRGTWVTYGNWDVMACARTNLSLSSLVREGGESYQNCADVRTWTGTTQRPANVNARWVPYFDMVQTRPGWAPTIFHTAWSRVADRSGSMDVIYHFSPETRGFARDERAWAQNSWNPANQTDAQKAYIARLADWLRDAHARTRRGFLYGSADPALPF